MKGIYKRAKKTYDTDGTPALFFTCLLELQSGDYRNFMLRVLLAVFKICSHLLFCRAAGTDRALWCCRKCQCCRKYAKYGLDCRICCKFGIYEPYLLQVWLIVPNLQQVWQRCSGSTNLALFGQRYLGSANLAAPNYKRIYRHNLSTSRFAAKNSSVSSNSTGEASESTPFGASTKLPSEAECCRNRCGVTSPTISVTTPCAGFPRITKICDAMETASSTSWVITSADTVSYTHLTLPTNSRV